MIILCDVDGVLANFAAALTTELAFQGHVTSPWDWKHFDMSANLTKDAWSAGQEIMTQRGFCASIPWYFEAKDFLSRLHSYGHVHAVTAPFNRNPFWMHERFRWLSADVVKSQIHFVATEHKQMIRGDVLIEDNPATCNLWLEANPEGQAILIDRPWNSPMAKEFWPHSRMHRAKSFNEVLALVSTFAETVAA